MSATLKKLSSVNDHFDYTALSKSTFYIKLKRGDSFPFGGKHLAPS